MEYYNHSYFDQKTIEVFKTAHNIYLNHPEAELNGIIPVDLKNYFYDLSKEELLKLSGYLDFLVNDFWNNVKCGFKVDPRLIDECHFLSYAITFANLTRISGNSRTQK